MHAVLRLKSIEDTRRRIRRNIDRTRPPVKVRNDAV
jgi:hypothetical protein